MIVAPNSPRPRAKESASPAPSPLAASGSAILTKTRQGPAPSVRAAAISVGSSLDAFGISLPFTQGAVTVAVAYVASPLYIRQAIAAFEATDPNLTAASRTLGAGPARTFFRVVLPLARGGLIAGLALSFARGLGEFGATIMFAGSLQGLTQTFSLAIYAEFANNFDLALAMGGVLVLVSVILLVTLRLGLSWQRSDSTTSPSLFGLSTSG